MTVTPQDAMLDALAVELARLNPADQVDTVTGMREIVAHLGQYLQDLDPAERDRVIRIITAENRHIAEDLAKLPASEITRAAREAVHRNRIAGKYAGTRGGPDAERVHQALQLAQHKRKAFTVCRHILAGGPAIARGGALLCIAHPRQGARCEQCHNAHVAITHDETEEHTCDGCRTVVELINPVACLGPTTFKVMDQQGRRRYVPAALFVTGIGYCDPCKATRADQLIDHNQLSPEDHR